MNDNDSNHSQGWDIRFPWRAKEGVWAGVGLNIWHILMRKGENIGTAHANIEWQNKVAKRTLSSRDFLSFHKLGVEDFSTGCYKSHFTASRLNQRERENMLYCQREGETRWRIHHKPVYTSNILYYWSGMYVRFPLRLLKGHVTQWHWCLSSLKAYHLLSMGIGRVYMMDIKDSCHSIIVPLILH